MISKMYSQMKFVRSNVYYDFTFKTDVYNILDFIIISSYASFIIIMYFSNNINNNNNIKLPLVQLPYIHFALFACRNTIIIVIIGNENILIQNPKQWCICV